MHIITPRRHKPDEGTTKRELNPYLAGFRDIVFENAENRGTLFYQSSDGR